MGIWTNLFLGYCSIQYRMVVVSKEMYASKEVMLDLKIAVGRGRNPTAILFSFLNNKLACHFQYFLLYNLMLEHGNLDKELQDFRGSDSAHFHLYD